MKSPNPAPAAGDTPAPQLQSAVEHVTWVHGTHAGVLELAGGRLTFTTEKKGRELDVALADVRLTFPRIAAGTEMDVHDGKDTWKFSFANTSAATVGMMGAGNAIGGAAGGALAGVAAVDSISHLVHGRHHLKAWREALQALGVAGA